MKRAALLALALLAQPAAGQDGTVRAFTNGLSLLAACTSDLSDVASACNGYITGVIDSEHLHPAPAPLCLPSGLTVHAARATFVAWARRHESMLNRAGAAVVRDALSDRWPCDRAPA